MDKFYLKLLVRRFRSNKIHYLLKIIVLSLGIAASGIILMKLSEMEAKLAGFKSTNSNLYRVVDANPDDAFIKGLGTVKGNEYFNELNVFSGYSFYSVKSVSYEIIDEIKIVEADKNFVDLNKISLYKENPQEVDLSGIYINQRLIEDGIISDPKIYEALKENGMIDYNGTYALNRNSQIRDFDVLIISDKFKSNKFIYTLQKSTISRDHLNRLFALKSINIDEDVPRYAEEILNKIKRDDTANVFVSMPYTTTFNDAVRTPAKIAEKLGQHKDIKSYTRLCFGNEVISGKNTKIIYADESIVSAFDIPFLWRSEYPSRNKAYISNSLHEILDKDSLDKNILYINGIEYRVKGVYEDFPEFYDIQGDVIAAIDPYLNKNKINNYYDYEVFTYVSVEEGASFRRINDEVQFWLQAEKPRSTSRLQFQPTQSRHFVSSQSASSRKDRFYITSLNALIILILISAAGGYAILSLIESSRRASEIGIRKLAGAEITEFYLFQIGEAVLLSLGALIISFLMLVIFQFVFYPANPGLVPFDIILDLLGISIFTAIISTLYPTFYLTKLKVREVLSGDILNLNKSVIFRDFILGFQLSLGMTIVIFAMVSNDQINFLKNEKLSYSGSHFISFADAEKSFYDKVKSLENIEVHGSGEDAVLLLKSHKLWDKLEEIENIWKQATNKDFKPEFSEAGMNEIYLFDKILTDVFTNLVILAVFISMISIYATSKFLSNERRQEFGIRKAFGASPWKLLKLTGNEFIRLLIISIIFSFLLAFFPLNTWLNNFDIRIDMPFDPYLFAIFSSLIILTGIVVITSIDILYKRPVNLMNKN